MERTRARRVWTVALFSGAALSGLSVQLRGAVLSNFQSTYSVSESQLGLVTPVGAVGFTVALLGVGFVAGRIGIRQFLLFGLAGTTVALWLIGFAPVYLLLLAFVGVRMSATGFFRALDRPLLSHLYPESRGRIYSLQTMAWAIGATAGPVLATVVLTWYTWRASYLIVGAAFIPLLVAVWWLDLPDSINNERSLSVSEFRTLINRPEIYGMGLLLVVVGSIESVFFTWLPYYASQYFPRAVANFTLSLYLTAYIPGRYVFSRLTGRYSHTNLILIVGSLLVVILFVAFFLAEGPVLLGSIFVAGFLVSGMFPTLLTLGTETTPTLSGPVNALAVFSAQAGFFVAPAVVGVLADVYSIQRAMVLQLFLAVVLIFFTFGMKYGPLRSAGSRT